VNVSQLKLRSEKFDDDNNNNNNNNNNKFLTMLEASHLVITVVTPSDSCGIDGNSIS
jgi:hypothetical protein